MSGRSLESARKKRSPTLLCPAGRYRLAFLLGAKQGGDVGAKFRPGRGSRQRKDVDDVPAPARLAYRVDEAYALLGVSRDTIERAFADGRLKSSKRLGVQWIDARSIEALFDDTSEG